MSNNQVNLGSLEYDQINTNLTNYLKSQTLLKDYNFDGSIIKTVISLLAYNTYYYALYSNMLANEMFLDTAQREQSLVSLLKPLGVTVPTKTSARANIKVGGSSSIPRFTLFNGINEDGIIFNFFNLTPYIEDVTGDNFIDDIVIVEGKQLIKEKNITSVINLTDQTYFLGDVNIDISTLIVEVDTGDGIFNEWIKMDNIGESTDTLSQTIYFVERFDTGFELQFGKENSLGNSILSTYNVRISYLVSSGSAPNTISTFTTASLPGNTTIQVNQVASGGLDSPDVDYYKFIAPKFFASQNRAVTKDDFLAISAEYLRAKGYDITKDNFTVFGGEELYPPKYGRVFIATEAVSNSDILDLVAHLKTKCTVSILPEYVETVSDTITYNVSCKLKNNNLSNAAKQQLLIKIKNFLNANFTFIQKFNIVFTGVQQALVAQFPNDISSARVTLNYKKTFPANSGKVTINIGNPFLIGFGIQTPITSFTDKTGRNVILKVNASTNGELDQLIDLKTFILNLNNETYQANLLYGTINVNAGFIEINDVYSTPFTVNLDLKNPSFTSNNNVKYSIFANNIELV